MVQQYEAVTHAVLSWCHYTVFAFQVSMMIYTMARLVSIEKAYMCRNQTLCLNLLLRLSVNLIRKALVL